MRVKPFAAPKEAAYLLTWSSERGTFFPVLSTRLDLITVIDIDICPTRRKEEWIREVFPQSFGFQNTPHGVHVYLPAGIRGTMQDPRYLVFSSNRRRWQERICESDGSWRPFPIAFTKELIPHQIAFAEARKLLARGVNTETEVEV